MTNDAIDWQVSLMEERVGNIFITSASGRICSEMKTMGENWKDLFNAAFSQPPRAKEKERDHLRLIHLLVISQIFSDLTSEISSSSIAPRLPYLLLKIQ